jgi:hypothetical protein
MATITCVLLNCWVVAARPRNLELFWSHFNQRSELD